MHLLLVVVAGVVVPVPVVAGVVVPVPVVAGVVVPVPGACSWRCACFNAVLR